MLDKATELIARHEGYVPTVYKCTEGFDTIGYGFAIKDLFLTKDVCDIILKQILEHNVKKFQEKFSWFKDLPETAQVVLMNMCYQMGIYGVSRFKKTLKAFESGDWECAADEMLDSLWAKQTPNRANELSEMIRNIND